jgi:hypothetical protein
MKKYSKGFEFVKDLIESDFLILDQASFNLKRKTSYTDVLETSRSLKHIVRTVQLLKKEELFRLFIWVEDNFLFDLAKEILIRQEYNRHLFITSQDFPGEKKEKASFILGKTELNLNGYYKKLVSSKVFLLNSIDSNFKNSGALLLGNYISYVNLGDIKKLIFILVLINNTLINLDEKNK